MYQLGRSICRYVKQYILGGREFPCWRVQPSPVYCIRVFGRTKRRFQTMDRITVAGILIPIVLLAAAFSVRTAHATSPRERAVQALDSLIDRYWNPALSMFNTADPCN